MNYRKILSGILSVAMCMSMTHVSAEDISINTPEIKGNVITVSGNAVSPETRVLVEIVRQNENYKDKNHVYFAKQIVAGEDGEFSVECEMPDFDRAEPEKSINGYFTVYVAASGYGREALDFSYISEASRTEFFKKLNMVEDAEALKAFLLNVENKMMMDAYNVYVDEFSGIDDSIKTLACELIADRNIEFTKDNINEINEIIIAMRLNGVNDKEAIKIVVESGDIAERSELIYKDISYETADDESKDWFYEVAVNKSAQNGFESVADLDILFKQSMVLKAVNDAHYSNVYSILNTNESVLELSECTAYKNVMGIADIYKTSVMKNLKDLGKSIKSVDELKSLLESAYRVYTQSLVSGGSSGSSGSSGGGSGSSFPSNVVMSGSLPKTEEVKVEADTDKEYFNDLAGYDWAKDAINTLAANNIVSGYGNGSFAPDKNVTRAEFLTMLLKATDLINDNASCSFADVSESDWCYKYIASAFEKGITSGIDENNFGKNNLITRQEAVTFMHRAAVKSYIPLEIGNAKEFADAESIAEWAKRSVRIMNDAGFVNGMDENNFMPTEYTTRAQAARMIFSLYELM